LVWAKAKDLVVKVVEVVRVEKVEKIFANSSFGLPDFSDFPTICSFKKIAILLYNQFMSIQMHFLFSLGLTSMSDASSFRDAVLAKIVLAQY